MPVTSEVTVKSLAFSTILQEQLAEVERHAMREVTRLQAENDVLRRLGVSAVLTEQRELRAQRSPPQSPRSPRRSYAYSSEGNCGGRVNACSSEELVQHQPSVKSAHSAEAVDSSCPSSKAELNNEEVCKLQRSLVSIFSVLDDGKCSYTSTEVRDIISRKKTTAVSGRFYKNRGWAQCVVRSSAFQYATLVMVLCNALWVAVDLDVNGQPLLASPPFFQGVEHFFVSVFTVEMVLRFLAFKRSLDVCNDPWFIFDLVLVSAMVVESWLVSLVVLSFHKTTENMTTLGTLSALRNFRLVRVARVAQLARFVPELQTMTNSMLAGMRAIGMMVAILLILTYGVAILMRQLGSSTGWGDEYFGNVPQAVYSLLVYTILPEHAALVERISDETWYCSLIYLLFVLFTVVMLMNMLVAFLCDVIFRESSAEKDLRNLEIMSEKLLSTFQSIGLNTFDLLSKEQFTEILTNEDAVGILAEVGVDVVALADESDFIFGTHRRPFMTFDSFKEEVLKFRSTNHATLGSITATRRFLRSGLGELSEKMDLINVTMMKLLQEMAASRRDSSRPSSARRRPRSKGKATL